MGTEKTAPLTVNEASVKDIDVSESEEGNELGVTGDEDGNTPNEPIYVSGPPAGPKPKPTS